MTEVPGALHGLRANHSSIRFRLRFMATRAIKGSRLPEIGAPRRPTTPPCRNLRTKHKIQFHPAVSKLLLRIISFSATRPWQVIDSLKPVHRVPVANVTHTLSDIAAMLSKTTPPPTPDGPSGEPARVITVRERKLVRGFVLPVFCVIGCHLSSLLVLADVYPLQNRNPSEPPIGRLRSRLRRCSWTQMRG